MLEAAFVAWLVALLGDRTVRGAARVLLGDPESRRLEGALVKATDVAITAMLCDIPSESREELSRTLTQRFKLKPVAVLDGHTRVRAALVTAIGRQIAPYGDQVIIQADKGFSGAGSNNPRWLATALADIAIRSIEQLGPGFPALMPLIVQLNADAAAERDEDAAVKIDQILALLEQQMQTTAASIRGGGRDRRFVPDSIDRLADALLQMPTILDDNSRNEILRRLPDPLRSAIPRSVTPRIQVYQIVETCGIYPHGLRDLRSVIYSFERDSLPMRRLDEMILTIGAADQEEGPPAIEAAGNE